MSTTLAETPTATFDTVADLIAHLGDVPPERVRLVPTPGTATEADLLALNDRKDGIFELVDGVLLEKAMGLRESRLAAVLIRLLDVWLDEHGLGIATGPDGMMRLAGNRYRAPDVAFIAWEQFPQHELPEEPYPNLFPNVAVEILGVGNRPGEMRSKRSDYFGSGTSLVWEIDPARESVTVYTDVDDATVLGKDDVVDGGTALPGFRFTFRELLDRAVHRH